MHLNYYISFESRFSDGADYSVHCQMLFCVTFLSQVLIHDQLSVSKVIQDGAEVCGVPVDKVGSGLIL